GGAGAGAGVRGGVWGVAGGGKVVAARRHELAAVNLDAEPLAVRLAAVADRTLTLLVCHCYLTTVVRSRSGKRPGRRSRLGRRPLLGGRRDAGGRQLRRPGNPLGPALQTDLAPNHHVPVPPPPPPS